MKLFKFRILTITFLQVRRTGLVPAHEICFLASLPTAGAGLVPAHK